MFVTGENPKCSIAGDLTVCWQGDENSPGTLPGLCRLGGSRLSQKKVVHCMPLIQMLKLFTADEGVIECLRTLLDRSITR